MELNATRFPFPLPPRTIGEQKAKVKGFLLRITGTLACALVGLQTLGIRTNQDKPARSRANQRQTRTGKSACATGEHSTMANLQVLLPGQPLRDCFRYICGCALLRRNLSPNDRKIRLARTVGRCVLEYGFHSAR